MSRNFVLNVCYYDLNYVIVRLNPKDKTLHVPNLKIKLEIIVPFFRFIYLILLDSFSANSNFTTN